MPDFARKTPPRADSPAPAGQEAPPTAGLTLCGGDPFGEFIGLGFVIDPGIVRRPDNRDHRRDGGDNGLVGHFRDIRPRAEQWWRGGGDGFGGRRRRGRDGRCCGRRICRRIILRRRREHLALTLPRRFDQILSRYFAAPRRWRGGEHRLLERRRFDRGALVGLQGRKPALPL